MSTLPDPVRPVPEASPEVVSTRPASGPGSPLHRLLSTLRRFWAPLLLVLVAVASSVPVTIAHGPAMSPVDEWVYTDYLYKVPEQGIVHQGESMGVPSREVIACDGVDPFGTAGPPCGSNMTASDAAFPNAAITTADSYTPLYFAPTRWIGDAIHEVTGVDQRTGWRLTGTLWLAGTVLALYGLMRSWRVPRGAAVALGVMFMGSPLAYWSYTFVSTDAPSVLMGAGILAAATALSRGSRHGWWILALAPLATLLKVTNVLAVCLAALFLGFVWLRGLWRRRSDTAPPPRFLVRHTPIIAAVGALALSIALELLWLVLRAENAVGPSPDQGITVPLTARSLVDLALVFPQATMSSNIISVYPIPAAMTAPLGWVCVAGILVSVMTLRQKDERTPLVSAIAISSLILAPLLGVFLLVTNGFFFEMPARYGAPLVPAFLLAAGLILRNRWAIGTVALYGAGLIGVAIVLTPLAAG